MLYSFIAGTLSGWVTGPRAEFTNVVVFRGQAHNTTGGGQDRGAGGEVGWGASVERRRPESHPWVVHSL